MVKRIMVMLMLMLIFICLIGACSGADDVAELESPSRLSNYHNCGSGIWLGAQGRCS